MTTSLCAFADPVATLPRCPRRGCPGERHDVCNRHGCPSRDLWPLAGLYDVDGSGEVVRLDVAPSYEITTEDMDTAWLLHSTHRAEATRWYADEMGVKFSEVRCSVEWLRCIDKYEDGRKVTAWADEMWFTCKPDDLGAYKFWRLELR